LNVTVQQIVKSVTVSQAPRGPQGADGGISFTSSVKTTSDTLTTNFTKFTGSTTGQTFTLPLAGTSGRFRAIRNAGTVSITLSGSSDIATLNPGDSVMLVDDGTDWTVF